MEEKIREMQWRKKWGNLCGDSAVRHLMQCAVRQMQVAPSLSLPVQVCSRLPVLDGDEEACCVPIGVSSRDDGGGDAYSIMLMLEMSALCCLGYSVWSKISFLFMTVFVFKPQFLFVFLFPFRFVYVVTSCQSATRPAVFGRGQLRISKAAAAKEPFGPFSNFFPNRCTGEQLNV